MRLIPRHLSNLPHIGEHNFLIHGLLIEFLERVAAAHASGTLVDIGCGLKPYASIFAPYVSRHTGVDLPGKMASAADVIGSAYETGLPDSSCDIVLCTEVLEHLEEPESALLEMKRILRPGGRVILTVPFFWHIHEAPRDFFRYSEFGLRHLFEKTGFLIVEITPLTGFLSTFSQLGIYYVRPLQRIPIAGGALRLLGWAAQHLLLRLNRYDKSVGFTALYGLVARKV